MSARNRGQSSDDSWGDFEFDADRDEGFRHGNGDEQDGQDRQRRAWHESDQSESDAADFGESHEADEFLESGFQMLGEFDINDSFDESDVDRLGTQFLAADALPPDDLNRPIQANASGTAYDSRSSNRLDDLPVAEDDLIEEFEQLWQLAEATWHGNFGNQGYEHYVAADFRQVYRTLKHLKDRCWTFLEWGSGLGVATIMADRMGMKAHGIEISPRLLETSREIAAQFGSKAQFVEGSFIPDDYQWDPEIGDSEFRTPLGGHTAYRSLDLPLADFDIIYAYPWPEETELFIDMMRQCGGRHGYFVTYHATEGIKVSRTKSARY